MNKVFPAKPDLFCATNLFLTIFFFAPLPMYGFLTQLIVSGSPLKPEFLKHFLMQLRKMQPFAGIIAFLYARSFFLFLAVLHPR